MDLLRAALLDFAVSGDGAQGHGGEHGAQEGDEHDQERLPYARAPHDVEEARKNEHPCTQIDTGMATTVPATVTNPYN